MTFEEITEYNHLIRKNAEINAAALAEKNRELMLEIVSKIQAPISQEDETKYWRRNFTAAAIQSGKSCAQAIAIADKLLYELQIVPDRNYNVTKEIFYTVDLKSPFFEINPKNGLRQHIKLMGNTLLKANPDNFLLFQYVTLIISGAYEIEWGFEPEWCNCSSPPCTIYDKDLYVEICNVKDNHFIAKCLGYH